MPLRSDLLNPISGSDASGQNLKYAPIYDKIKEARREEDDAAQGDWKRERKVADNPFVIKTVSEIIATKSKDLQLAAWLTEALLKSQGAAGLREGLDLLKALLENFWDTVYPELEDGDLELRAAPLEWVGTRLDQAVKMAPLARSGFHWFDYKQSRLVGYEEAAAQSEAKTQARADAIAEGKVTAEEFDKAVSESPKAYYVQLLADFDGALESLQAVDECCKQKFQDVAPGFNNLRGALEEVRQTVNMLLQKKRQQEPDEEQAPEEAQPETSAEESYATAAGAAAAPARARTPGTLAAEPADRQDAISRVISATRYLRREEPYGPAPYLMLRGLRWGELRAGAQPPDAALLEAPPTEVRQELKRLSTEGQWAEALEAAENAMGMACGRGWLDLQRYVCRACAELGSDYDAIAGAVRSALRALLADMPQLPQMTLLDDTSTANAETQVWIREQVCAEPQPVASMSVPSMDEETPAADKEKLEAAPAAYELAMEAARSGRAEEGIQILTREIERERSGRARFHKKVQLAQLCLSIGYESIAYPILDDLAAEIERRKLEDWEAPEVVAHPLGLLFRYLNQREPDSPEKQKLYARICRLDPMQALACSK